MTLPHESRQSNFEPPYEPNLTSQDGSSPHPDQRSLTLGCAYPLTENFALQVFRIASYPSSLISSRIEILYNYGSNRDTNDDDLGTPRSDAPFAISYYVFILILCPKTIRPRIFPIITRLLRSARPVLDFSI